MGKPATPGEPDPPPLALMAAHHRRRCISYSQLPNGSTITWTARVKSLRWHVRMQNVHDDGHGISRRVTLKQTTPTVHRRQHHDPPPNPPAHDAARTPSATFTSGRPATRRRAARRPELHDDSSAGAAVHVRPLHDWVMTTTRRSCSEGPHAQESMIQFDHGIAWEYSSNWPTRCIATPGSTSRHGVGRLCQAARHVLRDHLDKDLKLRVEYSNEV